MNHIEANFHTRQPGVSSPSPPASPPSKILFPIDFGEPVSGQKLIARTPAGYELANKDTMDHTKVVIGMTNTGSGTGAVSILAEGLYEDASMSLAIGPVWLDVGGNFTSSPPTSGFLMQVGKVVEPAKLYIHLLPAIVLA